MENFMYSVGPIPAPNLQNPSVDQNRFSIIELDINMYKNVCKERAQNSESRFSNCQCVVKLILALVPISPIIISWKSQFIFLLSHLVQCGLLKDEGVLAKP